MAHEGWRLERRTRSGEHFESSCAPLGKPALTPIGTDGQPLDAKSVVTLEARSPGYVELKPGERARSPVGWAGWDGPPCAGKVIVRWQGGQMEVNADGPRQPTRRGPATNLYTSWFGRVE